MLLLETVAHHRKRSHRRNCCLLWSLNLQPYTVNTKLQRRKEVRPDRYLVIDIGGGTADIANVSIHIEENALLSGNFCVGTTVNEEFSKFLQDFVDDLQFSCYIQTKIPKRLGSPEKQARHKANLNELLYTTFETLKRRFGSGDGRDIYICRSVSHLLIVYGTFWQFL